MLLTAQKNNRFATIFAAAVILTASFDIFLAFDVAGFTVRAAQILAIGLYVPALWNAFKERKIALPHGWKPLLVCLAALFAATFHSQWYVKNIAYDIWLLSLVAIVWAFTQLFSDPDSAKRLFRIYLIVFDLMAVLGIVQFLLAFFRIGEFFLTQYLVYWLIPRVNGFMYEPSYYATYMIMGWAVCASLLKEEKARLCGVPIKASFLLISVGVILSSSRMVYGCMVLWGGYYGLTWLADVFRARKLSAAAIKKLLWQGSVWVIALMYWIFVTIFGVPTPPPGGNQIGGLPEKDSVSDIMFQGLGADGNSANVDERTTAWKYTFGVFAKSPLLGCGLGAVTDEARLAAEPESNPLGSGNVLLELLAAGGIAAGVAAVAYVLSLLRPGWQQRRSADDSAAVVRALGFGLIGILVLLMWNATILRVYLWVHIAVLSMWMGVYQRQWSETK